MANYEKQVEQEAAYPIPISLYNCYRTVRQGKRGIAIYILLIAFLLPHCPVTVVQRYRDGVCSLLFHLFFIICHPYIPLHLEEMIFYTYLPTSRAFAVQYLNCSNKAFSQNSSIAVEFFFLRWTSSTRGRQCMQGAKKGLKYHKPVKQLSYVDP